MKFAKLAVVAASMVVSTSVLAQQFEDIVIPTEKGYLQDARKTVTRNSTGLCWETPYIKGACEPETAPVKTAAPAPAQAQPAPAPAAGPTSEKVTFAADAFFDFDKAVLKPEGQSKLNELAASLNKVDLEVIVAVGHTDATGPAAYNEKLSLRRAEAVKAYLAGKGIDAARIYTEGKGAQQPSADNKTRDGRAQNRRVGIEVVGTRK